MVGERVAVIGASGGSGRHVVAGLCDRGYRVLALGRDAQRLARLDPRAEARQVDVRADERLRDALDTVTHVVSLVPPWHVADVLGQWRDAHGRFVVGNSIRRYSRLTDHRAESARRAGEAFAAWPGRGVMLNFSMIYGHPEDGNVNGIILPIRRWPAALPLILPLPDGGRARLRPVFIEDMVTAVIAALERPGLDGRSIDVAGGELLSYADLIRHCSTFAGRRVLILDIPAVAMMRVLGAAERIGLPLPLTSEQVERATEDKIIDIAPQRDLLGLTAVGVAEGLRRKRERGW